MKVNSQSLQQIPENPYFKINTGVTRKNMTFCFLLSLILQAIIILDKYRLSLVIDFHTKLAQNKPHDVGFP